MYPTFEELTELMRHAGNKTREYAAKNSPRPYSSGKGRIKEVIKDIELLTGIIESAEKEKNIFPSCKEGCNACCMQAISINRFDADNIVNYLRNNYDAVTLAELKIRVDTLSRQLEGQFGKPPADKIQGEAFLNKFVELKSEYFKLQIMCPLNLNGRCMVYPVRPTSCWSYRAYGDPHDCSKSHDISHSIAYGGEDYQIFKVTESIRKGSIPKYPSYHMPAFLPQKLSEVMN